MSRKVRRVSCQIDSKGIESLPFDEIKAILRGADDLIMKGGRSLLARILKGSRAQDVLKLGLEQSPVYGCYRHLLLEEILARIDWVIQSGYLDIRYDGRLPLLVYSEPGWEVERETFVDELLRGFDIMLAAGRGPFDMSYLKERNRGMIMLLLDKVETTGDPKYVPLLEAWEQIDYKKVRVRIRHVIQHLRVCENIGDLDQAHFSPKENQEVTVTLSTQRRFLHTLSANRRPDTSLRLTAGSGRASRGGEQRSRRRRVQP